MFLSVTSFFILLTIFNVSSSSNEIEIKIPSYLKVCRRSDPKLNECVKKSIESLRPRLAQGIPELGLPPCEPLYLPRLALEQNAGAVNLHSEYTDIVVKGPSHFQLKGVRMDTNKNRIKLKMWFPHLTMQANYKLKGRILMMPLEGSGPCQGNYSDVDATANLQAEKVMKNGDEHLKVKSLIVDFNIGGANVFLADLFGGDPDLGGAMNKFLNDNWRAVAGELRPALEDALGNVLRGVADKMFAALPLRLLLPE